MEQVGWWGVGEGLHCLAETQPSTLPALAPVPGLDNKLHPHLGIIQLRQSMKLSCHPPPLAPQPRLHISVWCGRSLERIKAWGCRAEGMLHLQLHSSPPDRGLQLCQTHCTLEQNTRVRRGELAHGDPGAGVGPEMQEALLLPVWRVGIQSCPTCVLDSCWLPFLHSPLVHDAQTTHLPTLPGLTPSHISCNIGS